MGTCFGHHIVALVGGGRILKPSEIRLSHYGVLFLDELLEFQNLVYYTNNEYKYIT